MVANITQYGDNLIEYCEANDYVIYHPVPQLNADFAKLKLQLTTQ